MSEDEQDWTPVAEVTSLVKVVAKIKEDTGLRKPMVDEILELSEWMTEEDISRLKGGVSSSSFIVCYIRTEDADRVIAKLSDLGFEVNRWHTGTSEELNPEEEEG